MIGDILWQKPKPGPMARDALEAIGVPSDVDRINFEIRRGVVTVNGVQVAGADASLVYSASRCDPHDFQDDADELLVRHMRRAIIIRRLLRGGYPLDVQQA